MEEAITRAVVSAQRTNANGSAVVAWREDGKIEYNRKMKFEDDYIKSIIADYDRIVFHFRISTGGNINEANAHLWQHGNWMFGHNGFTSIKTKDMADSWHVLQDLIATGAITENDLFLKGMKCAYRKAGLSGKTIFVNPTQDKVIFTGDYNINLLEESVPKGLVEGAGEDKTKVERRQALILASGYMDFDNSLPPKQAFGFYFKNEEKAFNVLKGDAKGIFKIEKKEFSQIKKEDATEDPFRWNGGMGYQKHFHYPRQSYYGGQTYKITNPTNEEIDKEMERIETMEKKSGELFEVQQTEDEKIAELETRLGYSWEHFTDEDWEQYELELNGFTEKEFEDIQDIDETKIEGLEEDEAYDAKVRKEVEEVEKSLGIEHYDE